MPFALVNNDYDVPNLSINLTSVAITDSSGEPVTYTSAEGSLPGAALFDTGTTGTVLPADIVADMASRLDLTPAGHNNAGNQQYYVPCDLSQGQVQYTFGDANQSTDYGISTLTISVPYDRLVQSAIDPSNPDACIWGIAGATEGQVVLGDTFMQSCYTLFDVEANTISLAQSNPNAVSSDVTAL